MKFLVLSKARVAVVPPADPIAAVKEAVDWMDARIAEGVAESVYGIVPNMAMSIWNAASHEELWRTMTDYPLFGLWDWEIYPLCDLNEFANQRLKILKRMAGK